MVRVKIPVLEEAAGDEVVVDPRYDPPADTLLRELEDKGVIRYEELVEEDTLPVRQTLDALEMEGTIERFAVGEKMMVKLLVEDTDGVTLR